MSRFLRIGGLLVLVVATACATPIGVREVDRGAVRHVLSANAISADEPSISSRQVLLRLGLAARMRTEPEAVLKLLHDKALEELTDMLCRYLLEEAAREETR